MYNAYSIDVAYAYIKNGDLYDGNPGSNALIYFDFENDVPCQQVADKDIDNLVARFSNS